MTWELGALGVGLGSVLVLMAWAVGAPVGTQARSCWGARGSVIRSS